MAVNPTTPRNSAPEGMLTITPSDSTLLSGLQYIYIGVSGDVALKGYNDATATVFKAVPQGSLLPFGAGYVMSTNTTATNIAAFY